MGWAVCSRFHTDPGALFNGEYLWIDDPTNLMKRREGPGVTCNLNYVTKMDKAQGQRIFNAYGKATFSAVSDVFAIFGGTLAKAGVKGVSIISGTMTGVDAAWATNNNWDELTDSSKDVFARIMTAVDTYAPVWGTIKDFQKAAKEAGYTVTYYYF